MPAPATRADRREMRYRTGVDERRPYGAIQCSRQNGGMPVPVFLISTFTRKGAGRRSGWAHAESRRSRRTDSEQDPGGIEPQRSQGAQRSIRCRAIPGYSPIPAWLPSGAEPSSIATKRHEKPRKRTHLLVPFRGSNPVWLWLRRVRLVVFQVEDSDGRQNDEASVPVFLISTFTRKGAGRRRGWAHAEARRTRSADNGQDPGPIEPQRSQGARRSIRCRAKPGNSPISAWFPSGAEPSGIATKRHEKLRKRTHLLVHFRAFSWLQSGLVAAPAR